MVMDVNINNTMSKQYQAVLSTKELTGIKGDIENVGIGCWRTSIY